MWIEVIRPKMLLSQKRLGKVVLGHVRRVHTHHGDHKVRAFICNHSNRGFMVHVHKLPKFKEPKTRH